MGLLNMSEDRDPNARLDTHEAVCAERYTGINARLKRIEGLFIGAAGAIILMLWNIVQKVG